MGITTVRSNQTAIGSGNGTLTCCAISVSGEAGHFVDVFRTREAAEGWAKDVLVAHFDHTYGEAHDTVIAGREGEKARV